VVEVEDVGVDNLDVRYTPQSLVHGSKHVTKSHFVALTLPKGTLKVQHWKPNQYQHQEIRNEKGR
jgi:hypothetical protein